MHLFAILLLGLFAAQIVILSVLAISKIVGKMRNQKCCGNCHRELDGASLEMADVLSALRLLKQPSIEASLSTEAYSEIWSTFQQRYQSLLAASPKISGDFIWPRLVLQYIAIVAALLAVTNLCCGFVSNLAQPNIAKLADMAPLFAGEAVIFFFMALLWHPSNNSESLRPRWFWLIDGLAFLGLLSAGISGWHIDWQWSHLITGTLLFLTYGALARMGRRSIDCLVAALSVFATVIISCDIVSQSIGTLPATVLLSLVLSGLGLVFAISTVPWFTRRANLRSACYDITLTAIALTIVFVCKDYSNELFYVPSTALLICALALAMLAITTIQRWLAYAASIVFVASAALLFVNTLELPLPGIIFVTGLVASASLWAIASLPCVLSRNERLLKSFVQPFLLMASLISLILFPVTFANPLTQSYLIPATLSLTILFFLLSWSTGFRFFQFLALTSVVMLAVQTTTLWLSNQLWVQENSVFSFVTPQSMQCYLITVTLVFFLVALFTILLAKRTLITTATYDGILRYSKNIFAISALLQLGLLDWNLAPTILQDLNLLSIEQTRQFWPIEVRITDNVFGWILFTNVNSGLLLISFVNRRSKAKQPVLSLMVAFLALPPLLTSTENHLYDTITTFNVSLFLAYILASFVFIKRNKILFLDIKSNSAHSKIQQILVDGLAIPFIILACLQTVNVGLANNHIAIGAYNIIGLIFLAIYLFYYSCQNSNAMYAFFSGICILVATTLGSFSFRSELVNYLSIGWPSYMPYLIIIAASVWGSLWIMNQRHISEPSQICRLLNYYIHIPLLLLATSYAIAFLCLLNSTAKINPFMTSIQYVIYQTAGHPLSWLALLSVVCLFLFRHRKMLPLFHVAVFPLLALFVTTFSVELCFPGFGIAFLMLAIGVLTCFWAIVMQYPSFWHKISYTRTDRTVVPILLSYSLIPTVVAIILFQDPQWLFWNVATLSILTVAWTIVGIRSQQGIALFLANGLATLGTAFLLHHYYADTSTLNYYLSMLFALVAISSTLLCILAVGAGPKVAEHLTKLAYLWFVALLTAYGMVFFQSEFLLSQIDYHSLIELATWKSLLALSLISIALAMLKIRVGRFQFTSFLYQVTLPISIQVSALTWTFSYHLETSWLAAAVTVGISTLILTIMYLFPLTTSRQDSSRRSLHNAIVILILVLIAMANQTVAFNEISTLYPLSMLAVAVIALVSVYIKQRDLLISGLLIVCFCCAGSTICLHTDYISKSAEDMVMVAALSLAGSLLFWLDSVKTSKNTLGSWYYPRPTVFRSIGGVVLLLLISTNHSMLPSIEMVSLNITQQLLGLCLIICIFSMIGFTTHRRTHFAVRFASDFPVGFLTLATALCLFIVGIANSLQAGHHFSQREFLLIFLSWIFLFVASLHYATKQISSLRNITLLPCFLSALMLVFLRALPNNMTLHEWCLNSALFVLCVNVASSTLVRLAPTLVRVKRWEADVFQHQHWFPAFQGILTFLTAIGAFYVTGSNPAPPQKYFGVLIVIILAMAAVQLASIWTWYRLVAIGLFFGSMVLIGWANIPTDDPHAMIYRQGWLIVSFVVYLVFWVLLGKNLTSRCSRWQITMQSFAKICWIATLILGSVLLLMDLIAKLNNGESIDALPLLAGIGSIMLGVLFLTRLIDQHLASR